MRAQATASCAPAKPPTPPKPTKTPATKAGNAGRLFFSSKLFERSVYFTESPLPSLQVASDDVDHFLGSFFGRLRILRHVIPDVIFQQLAHKAVDRSSGCCQALEHVRAPFVFVQTPQDPFTLPD